MKEVVSFDCPLFSFGNFVSSINTKEYFGGIGFLVDDIERHLAKNKSFWKVNKKHLHHKQRECIWDEGSQIRLVSLSGLLKLVYHQDNVVLEEVVAQTFLNNALELRNFRQKEQFCNSPATKSNAETQTADEFGNVKEIIQALDKLNREEFAIVSEEVKKIEKLRVARKQVGTDKKSKIGNERAEQILEVSSYIFGVKGRSDHILEDVLDGFQYTFQFTEVGQQIWNELVKKRFNDLFQLTHQEVFNSLLYSNVLVVGEIATRV